MIIVKSVPPAGSFTEFLRVDIVASDDGTTQPPAVAPFEILYTSDGSIPSDTNTATKVRRSPVKQLPISGPTTLKFFARTLVAPFVQTDIQVQYYAVQELTARNTILTVDPRVRNYTLKIDDNGDIVRTSPGQYDVVFGLDKMKQDIKEVILVEDVPQNQPVGDRTLPQFGSALNRILGKSFPIGFAASQIQASLFDALTTLIDLERDERVPADEQIRRILSITVSPLDPTTFSYSITVEAVTGAKLTDSGTIVGS